MSERKVKAPVALNDLVLPIVPAGGIVFPENLKQKEHFTEQNIDNHDLELTGTQFEILQLAMLRAKNIGEVLDIIDTQIKVSTHRRAIKGQEYGTKNKEKGRNLFNPLD